MDYWKNIESYTNTWHAATHENTPVNWRSWLPCFLKLLWKVIFLQEQSVVDLTALVKILNLFWWSAKQRCIRFRNENIFYRLLSIAGCWPSFLNGQTNNVKYCSGKSLGSCSEPIRYPNRFCVRIMLCNPSPPTKYMFYIHTGSMQSVMILLTKCQEKWKCGLHFLILWL